MGAIVGRGVAIELEMAVIEREMAARLINRGICLRRAGSWRDCLVLRTESIAARVVYIGCAAECIAARVVYIVCEVECIAARVNCLGALESRANSFLRVNFGYAWFNIPPNGVSKMPDYIPKPDVEASAYFNRVLQFAENDDAPLIMPLAAVAALRALASDFADKILSVENARAGLANAVAVKDEARAAVEVRFRAEIQRVQVDPLVTDSKRVAAGIPVRDTIRTTSAPVTPSALVAVADAAGINNLTWDGSANASGIQYVVEAKIAPALDFSTVDVVTAQKFAHTAQMPGRNVVYRVKARRGTATSAPSNTASVY